MDLENWVLFFPPLPQNASIFQGMKGRLKCQFWNAWKIENWWNNPSLSHFMILRNDPILELTVMVLIGHPSQSEYLAAQRSQDFQVPEIVSQKWNRAFSQTLLSHVIVAQKWKMSTSYGLAASKFVQSVLLISVHTICQLSVFDSQFPKFPKYRSVVTLCINIVQHINSNYNMQQFSETHKLQIIH